MATYFITGFPGFIGTRLVRAALQRTGPRDRFVVLVQRRVVEEAQKQLAKLGDERVELMAGDVADIHLGLGGREYRALAKEITHIFHLAAVQSLGASDALIRRVNVDGTRGVIELGRDAPGLERLVHFSSCYVSGDRVGVVAEDELEAGQGFRTTYEASKYEAERHVRRAAELGLPVTILRPATVVGDSRTGEVDRFEGPYAVGMMLVLSPLAVPLPLPGNGVAPLNVVPVDYVVDAAWALAHLEGAKGKTLHLVDPQPLSARRVYEEVAKRANRRLPPISLSPRATDFVLRLPGLERLARPQRVAIAYVNQLVFYSCAEAQELLLPQGIRCPPLKSYLPTLVDYALATWRSRALDPKVLEDPLDHRP